MSCTIEIFHAILINFCVTNFSRLFLLVILTQQAVLNQYSFNKLNFQSRTNKSQKPAEACQLLGITMHRLGVLYQAVEIAYHRLGVIDQVLATAKQCLVITDQCLAAADQRLVIAKQCLATADQRLVMADQGLAIVNQRAEIILHSFEVGE